MIIAERNESFRPLDGCKVAKLQIYRINDFLFKPGGLVYIGTCKLLLKTLRASRHHKNGSQRTIPRLIEKGAQPNIEITLIQIST